VGYLIESSGWLDERHRYEVGHYDALAWPETHPLSELPESALTVRSMHSEIEWEMRTNPSTVERLVEASCLCSQRLFQYNLALDGQSRARVRPGPDQARPKRLVSRDGLSPP